MTGMKKSIEVNHDLYGEYEELLLRRDQMNVDADSYQIVYTREFGDLIIKNFELKIECIRRKKTISACMRRMNRGLGIDVGEMQKDIEKEMTAYYVQLKEMTDRNLAAKDAEIIDGYSVRRSKKIYRRIAKRLHPDVNKKTMENETLKDLWMRTVKAYRNSEAEELENLEVLIRRALKELGDEGFEINLDDIEERIAHLEAEIHEIATTEPYTYGAILGDKEKIRELKEALEEEYADYERYLAQLDAELEKLIGIREIRFADFYCSCGRIRFYPA